MSTAIQQGVSTWYVALLNENSTWRPYGISSPPPPLFLGGKARKQEGKLCRIQNTSNMALKAAEGLLSVIVAHLLCICAKTMIFEECSQVC
jgi:hypothetical protein